MTVRYRDLDIEQQKLLKNLAAPGHHVVSAPPGSGKSLLSVHRAVLEKTAGRPVTLITHSNLLRQLLQAQVDALKSTVEVMTYHGWVQRWHRKATGKGISGFSFDWAKLLEVAFTHAAKLDQTLIIDEGQDLPQGFYSVFRFAGARMIVFADEYQRIDENQSTIEEIRAALGEHRMHELSLNLRNTAPIAEFARRFHVGLRPPPLPARDGSAPVLLHRPEKVAPFVRWLVKYTTDHPSRSIGVVVQHTADQEKILRAIEKEKPGLRPQLYVGNAPAKTFREVDFNRPGLVLVTRQSVKGLEFDTVVVFDLHQGVKDPTEHDTRMLHYVLATRARQELYLFYCGDREPPIVADIPEKLLRRDILPENPRH